MPIIFIYIIVNLNSEYVVDTILMYTTYTFACLTTVIVLPNSVVLRLTYYAIIISHGRYCYYTALSIEWTLYAVCDYRRRGTRRVLIKINYFETTSSYIENNNIMDHPVLF